MKKSEDVIIKHIKTKNKIRKIATYVSEGCKLRKEHENILKYLNKNFINSKFAKAYVKNRSIYSNAKVHLYNDCFIMLDVKDFFNSINHKNLIEKLYYEINKPNKKIYYQIDESNRKLISKIECANIISKCSLYNKGIPLGFITSPILSNIYMKDFDGILYGQLKKFKDYNIIYSRYADDMTISFKDNQDKKEIENEIINITEDLLKRYGLKLNNKKTRSYDLTISNHVKITGINIVKEEDNYRRMTVGKKVKNKLFWDALKCYRDGNHDYKCIEGLKGMQSFILSIEKKGYEECYSENMKNIINELGFSSLKELIDSLFYIEKN
ncbi:RNA-directed DNA polymerase [Clostridium botulinum]|uniref:reverse transcriptase family protein n=1 Tax=Clostridium botulinum TaxID=1491 RepID=UPI0019676BC0|nr:reverse transcriptase family protein [Clostridium botulinum]MBN1061401.1 RNA-directed DNA polymerase [Clostridium botulinum]